MKKIALFALFITSVTACTVLKVSELKSDGLFRAVNTAKTITAEKVNLDTINTLLVVPNGEYMKGMSSAIGYFKEIMTIEEFEKAIILANKQDDVGALSGNIGLNKAFRKYRKFLYLKFDKNEKKTNRLQLKLINPGTTDEIFVAESIYDVVWEGVYDNNTFNPLFNELIKYIVVNSPTYSLKLSSSNIK